MNKVIVIFGPTASGKSSVAVEVAKALDGEIISADSMQIYRGMNIGTAKITNSEMNDVPHHLIDIVDPSENYSVADFKSSAETVIKDIFARRKTPVICGGTGLYIDALVKNISFETNNVDYTLRNELFQQHSEKGSAWMHDVLEKLDPDSAKVIHENNVKRVIRAIEVTTQTGIPFSKQKNIAVSQPSKFDFLMFGLARNRENLYARINERVEMMFEAGLETEYLKLSEGVGNPSFTSTQAIGYKELDEYFAGRQTMQEAKEKIKMETRRYAKRQITWFKRYTEALWIDCDNLTTREISKQILNSITNV
ncbi:MAG: tRNA (adenosine(37)-N6)-dimethylallyltransferase MiaA [Bacillota bacterium]